VVGAACRNMGKAEKARREIIDASGNDLVEVMQVPPTRSLQLRLVVCCG